MILKKSWTATWLNSSNFEACWSYDILTFTHGKGIKIRKIFNFFNKYIPDPNKTTKLII